MANFNRWNAQDEASALRDQLKSYCANGAAISDRNKPPGVNAANGHFANEMLSDTDMALGIKPRTYYTDQEVVKLYDVTYLFFNSMKGAFSAGTHSASVATSPGDFIQYLVQLVPQIRVAVQDLLTIASFNPAAIAGIVQKIGDDIQALVDAVSKTGAKFDGDHANGYIGSGVQGAAAQTLAALAPVEAALTRNETKSYAAVLRAVCTRLKAIELHEYRPWLNAEWQVQFEAVMKAGAEAAAA